MNQDSRVVFIAVLVAVLGGGAWFWWRQQQQPVPIAAAPAPLPPPVAPAPPPATPPDAAPAILHPIAPAAAPKGREMPPLAADEADAYVKNALVDLLGLKAVRSFLNLDGFVDGFVATADNLGNERAQTQFWPVKPTPGRFQTEARGGALAVISAQNAARYAPFVRMVESANTRRAVAIYVRLYPAFQAAYEALGYPGKYFNDRVVEVIDHLIATPNLEGPIRVKRVEVEGGTRPGGLYQFEDPSLEARSAGQKILLRMGPENAAALKAKLADVREQLVARAPRARR